MVPWWTGTFGGVYQGITYNVQQPELFCLQFPKLATGHLLSLRVCWFRSAGQSSTPLTCKTDKVRGEGHGSHLSKQHDYHLNARAQAGART